MKLEDMSQLFDVDPSSSFDDPSTPDDSEYGSEDHVSSSQTFEDRVGDMKSFVGSEPDADAEVESDIIVDAIKDAVMKPKEVERKKVDPAPVPDLFDDDLGIELNEDGDPNISDDVELAVDNDIEAFAMLVCYTDSVQEGVESEVESEVKSSKKEDEVPEVHNDIDLDLDLESQIELEDMIAPESVRQEDADKAKKSRSSADANPLGLTDPFDIRAFHDLKRDFPQFTLYDGSPSFRDFYRSKFHSLKSLLTNYQLLDFADMKSQLQEVNVKIFIGSNQTVTPDLIRVRLDECYRSRVRVSELLVPAIAQFYAWERFSEMLRAKLWKDHDLKGAHRRDGLTIEHMADMEEYLAKLRDYVEVARQYDSMLKAAAESLSRQLSCLHEMKEATGFTQEMHYKIRQQQGGPAVRPASLEGLDTIDEGTVIKAPEFKREPTQVDWGVVESDDLAELG